MRSASGVSTFHGPKSYEHEAPPPVTCKRLSEGTRVDRLLVETDSPYLAPVPHRGKRNEPAYVARVVEQLAEVRGTTAEAIGEQTDRNFDRLFHP